jgi:hypothetical protein
MHGQPNIKSYSVDTVITIVGIPEVWKYALGEIYLLH